MAHIAARKALVSKIISKSPANIKPSIEQLCADARSLDALQHYAMVTSKQEGCYPLTPELVALFDMSAEFKALLSQDTAVLAYLNELLSQFQQH